MCFGNHGVPYGLCNSLSTLRLTVTSFNARLGTGEWLILTRYRLIEDILVLSSLYKKHQALLDALTMRFSRSSAATAGLYCTVGYTHIVSPARGVNRLASFVFGGRWSVFADGGDHPVEKNHHCRKKTSSIVGLSSVYPPTVIFIYCIEKKQRNHV